MTRTLTGPVFFLALVVMAIAAYVAIVPKMQATAWPAVNLHPVEKHGVSVVAAVDKCFANSGPMATFHNPVTGRKAQICQMENGKFAIRVDESDGSLVTKFVKDKLKTFSQVAQYLRNCGYTPLQ